jgi:hypothetical protein
MDPIDFEGSNCTFAKDQPEYIPLPVCKVPGAEGEILSVWKPTDEERKQIAEGANIELSVWTFNYALQPLRMFVSQRKEKIAGN